MSFLRKKLVLLTLLSGFLLCPAVLGQESDKCDHTTSSNERFELMRIAPPSKVTYFDGMKLEISHSDSKAVYIRTFELDSETVISDYFKRNWKTGLWWVIYCSKDLHVYSVTRVDPKQLK